MRAVDRTLDEEEYSLARWALNSIKDGRLKHIVDPDIRNEIYPKCLKGFVQIVERCLDNNQEHRPTMDEVVSTLESLLSLQQKTNDLLQAAGKTKFSTTVNKFSMAAIDNNSGMEFAFRMPGKRKLLMLREKKSSNKMALYHLQIFR
ncbi:hypothetical protein L1987_14408 [Smallanthus sonchifolius]|uniref:Uncharacterized protein n=1 Tax=Smallanthus sonchifolius TaxID=185202 RepID=A0ACB9J2M7_9ASTR|nr:hypothetical protein L1987_14408 [Smallanthus sonchifolius]